MRIGVTGHVLLSAESTGPIYSALMDALSRYPGVEGVTCLAAGADQIFARAMLARDAEYDVVLPAWDYQSHAVVSDNRADFEDLLHRARDISVMPFDRSGREAYLAAGEEVLSRCDVLIAVWDSEADGRPSISSDVVSTARRQGKKVVIVWPSGASRSAPHPEDS